MFCSTDGKATIGLYILCTGLSVRAIFMERKCGIVDMRGRGWTARGGREHGMSDGLEGKYSAACIGKGGGTRGLDGKTKGLTIHRGWIERKGLEQGLGREGRCSKSGLEKLGHNQSEEDGPVS